MIRHQLLSGPYERSYGVVALLDPYSEQVIRSIWRGLEVEQITASLPSIICAQPHITLGIFSSLQTTGLASLLPPLAAHIAPFAVTFGSVGAFPAIDGASVFLQPTVTQQLMHLHYAFYATCNSKCGRVHSYYEPEYWVPHCSVGIGLPLPLALQTLRFCLQLQLPIVGQIQALSVLEMVRQGKNVIAGCEVARWALGSGAPAHFGLSATGQVLVFAR